MQIDVKTYSLELLLSSTPEKVCNQEHILKFQVQVIATCVLNASIQPAWMLAVEIEGSCCSANVLPILHEWT